MPFPRLLGKALTSVFLASIAVSSTPLVANANTDLVDNKPPASSSSVKSLPKGEQRYIVQYNDNVNAEAKSEALTQQGIEVKDTFSHSMKASVVVASPKEIESLKTSVDVAMVEVDQPVKISGATSIWGLDRIDQRTGRDGQYNVGNEGTGVNAYVVDSGIRSSHVEFRGRITGGWNGINDGRGIEDCNGHGTHVAGTVAGTTYGVAKNANIIPLRVLECDGSGWSSTVVAALDWAAAHHQPGQPAVMNMSIGGFTTASLDRAVRNVINDGITVVAAAGNSNVDACYSAPASIPPAITVAATDINDYAASFSNYGSCVDIQAPGVSIRSAYNNADTGYNTMGGTSMASPHVAGAAAVLLSRTPSLSPAQVHQIMIDNSTVGVVIGNKSSTPNRMLFLPPYSFSCANIKLGEAWAGVGLTCQGHASSGSSESSPASSDSSTSATIGVEPDSNPEPVKQEPAPAAPVEPAPAAPVEPAPAAPVEPAPAAPVEPAPAAPVEPAPAAPVEPAPAVITPKASAKIPAAPVVSPVLPSAPVVNDSRGFANKTPASEPIKTVKTSAALETILTYVHTSPLIELASEESPTSVVEIPSLALNPENNNTEVAETLESPVPSNEQSSNGAFYQMTVWLLASLIVILMTGAFIKNRFAL